MAPSKEFIKRVSCTKNKVFNTNAPGHVTCQGQLGETVNYKRKAKKLISKLAGKIPQRSYHSLLKRYEQVDSKDPEYGKAANNAAKKLYDRCKKWKHKVNLNIALPSQRKLIKERITFRKRR